MMTKSRLLFEVARENHRQKETGNVLALEACRSSSASRRDPNEAKMLLRHEQVWVFTIICSCEVLGVNLRELEDTIYVGMAREFATNEKSSKNYQFIESLDFGDRTNNDVWKTASHQPQGPHSGSGRLRNKEYVKIDEVVFKVVNVKYARKILTGLEHDGRTWAKAYESYEAKKVKSLKETSVKSGKSSKSSSKSKLVSIEESQAKSLKRLEKEIEALCNEKGSEKKNKKNKNKKSESSSSSTRASSSGSKGKSKKNKKDDEEGYGDEFWTGNNIGLCTT